MAATPVFDLDQAVDNAMARVIYGIRLAAEVHENHLMHQAQRLRTRQRDRLTLLSRELRGITYPTYSFILHKDHTT